MKLMIAQSSRTIAAISGQATQPFGDARICMHVFNYFLLSAGHSQSGENGASSGERGAGTGAGGTGQGCGGGGGVVPRHSQ